MRGVWKRSHGRATKAPPDERGGKPICSTYSRRATLLLYRERQVRAKWRSFPDGVTKGSIRPRREVGPCGVLHVPTPKPYVAVSHDSIFLPC